MSTKKSKNNPQNRNQLNKNICCTCNETKKWTMISSGSNGKRKMASRCKCGIIDKKGTKI